NCTTNLSDRDGAEPCQECDSCRSFSEGRSLNVIEIDAASNNKVDDVRELRDTVRVPPQGGAKKVYIVDEVHMLSTSAFNALLKTLEEPPPYALFIFATTEPNKVLPTILSRCQRFDFRRIPVVETAARINSIAAEESIVIDEASVLLIARKGDGALRDALSVFDQAVALCGAEVTYDALADALGVVDIELYFETTGYVRERSSAGILDIVQRIVAAGFDLQEFLSGLAEHVRNLLVARTMPDTTLIEASKAVRDRYEQESKAFSPPVLMRLLAIASETESDLRSSAQPRLRLELGLLKMVNAADTVDLREALEKLDRLAGMPIAGGHKAAGTGDAGIGSKDAEGGVPSKDSPASDRTVRGGNTSARHDKPKPAREPEASGAGETKEGVSDRTATLEPVEEVATVESVDPPRSEPDAVGVPDLFGPPALSGRQRGNGNGGAIEGSAARSVASDAPATGIVPDEQPRQDADSVTNWLPFVKAVKADRIHVGSLLQHTAPSTLASTQLVIDVPDDFHKRLLENQQQFLLQHARAIISETLSSLRFTIRNTVRPPEGETGEDFDPYEYMKEKRQSNPVIRAIFDEFGGELVW
ncbi:MAG: DNA polymerase III subunit gamma/tau, partial [Rhodothermales bacterium]|nr:DNA polymerase III subunit gamma/tau [Rhodothermales bacterium]